VESAKKGRKGRKEVVPHPVSNVCGEAEGGGKKEGGKGKKGKRGVGAF